jgi:hydrogenase nickel incorporation protein HypA/HybF
MHELAICRAIISQISEIAIARTARIRTVRISVGPLAGVEPHFLRAAYPLAALGTAAEGSQLAIETNPLRIRCRGCGKESIALPNRLLCDACGDWRTDLISGDEMLLLSVELETPRNAEAIHV